MVDCYALNDGFSFMCIQTGHLMINTYTISHLSSSGVLIMCSCDLLRVNTDFSPYTKSGLCFVNSVELAICYFLIKGVFVDPNDASSAYNYFIILYFTLVRLYQDTKKWENFQVPAPLLYV
jgi:NhaP-type Na+/H+ and K+/H+ antiporter